MNQPIPLSRIRHLVRQQLVQAQRGPTGFDCFHRTLFEYRHWLPTYATPEGSLDFLAVVERAVREKGRASVLDVGCGAGYALAELEERYGDGVQAYGVTAYDYRPVTPIESEKAKLYSLPHYIVADAHNLLRLQALQGLSFDCVVMVESLRFFADPLSVLKAAYRLLSPGGFLFLTPWRARVVRPQGGRLWSG
ncbi:MAG: class I SAM-dependent methyltransferase, partial [Dehalococcoidia bacterium]